MKEITQKLDAVKITEQETKKGLYRGCCDECGEGFDNEEEWKYNTHCAVCGHPIPKNKIIKRKQI